MESPFLERFWAKVDKSGECWLWTGATNRSRTGQRSYGRFRMGEVDVLYQAHRLSYEMAYGPVPVGLDVCHTCDNPPCVNPAHLMIGTRKFNMADARRKGRCRGGITRGSASRFTKLNEAKVAEIRERYKAGDIGQTLLGEEYGVSRDVIARIVHAKSWRHVGTEDIRLTGYPYRPTCKRGHEMTFNGKRRICRTCIKGIQQRYNERRRHGVTKGIRSTPAFWPSEAKSTSL